MSTPLRYLTPIIFIKVAQLDRMFPHIKLPNSLNPFTACKNRVKFVEIHQIGQNTECTFIQCQHRSDKICLYKKLLYDFFSVSIHEAQ